MPTPTTPTPTCVLGKIIFVNPRIWGDPNSIKHPAVVLGASPDGQKCRIAQISHNILTTGTGYIKAQATNYYPQAEANSEINIGKLVEVPTINHKDIIWQPYGWPDLMESTKLEALKAVISKNNKGIVLRKRGLGYYCGDALCRSLIRTLPRVNRANSMERKPRPSPFRTHPKVIRANYEERRSGPSLIRKHLKVNRANPTERRLEAAGSVGSHSV